MAPITARARSGERCITRRPITAREHYDAAVWLEHSPERIAFWRDEAIREQENHS